MTDIEKILVEARKEWEIKDAEELSIQTFINEEACDHVWSERTCQHRWYDSYDYVCKVGDIYFVFEWYEMTGDSCMGDMGLELDESTIRIVERKERVITEVYYA
jgi:hypothetical protein